MFVTDKMYRKFKPPDRAAGLESGGEPDYTCQWAHGDGLSCRTQSTSEQNTDGRRSR